MRVIPALTLGLAAAALVSSFGSAFAQTMRERSMPGADGGRIDGRMRIELDRPRGAMNYSGDMFSRGSDGPGPAHLRLAPAQRSAGPHIR